MTYQELQSRVSGTCTHTVDLKDKDGNTRMGVYNGLSNWGEVYLLNNGVNCYEGVTRIDSFSHDWEEDLDDPEGGYCPNFTEKDFVKFGYQLA